MKRSLFIRITLLALSFYTQPLWSELHSVHNPVTITEDTTIELRTHLIIDAKGSPFIARQNSDQKTGKLIITSKNRSAIIVTPTGVWDLSSFNAPRKSIEFRGNARLILHPGARLHGSQTALVFAEQSRIE